MGRQEPHCTICGPEAKGVFCTLTGAHLERLDREKVVHHYDRDDTIFHAGNSPLAIYCIYSGRVKLYKTGGRGEEQVIRLLGRGEILGYRALLANEPYAATAVALEPTTICMVLKETLFDLLQQSPELAMRLMAKMARELRASEELLVSQRENTALERTAQLLLWFYDNGHRSGVTPAKLRIPLSRSEMAHMVGATPETLSRMLRSLAGHGVLELKRREIWVCNANALRAFTRPR